MRPTMTLARNDRPRLPSRYPDFIVVGVVADVEADARRAGGGGGGGGRPSSQRVDARRVWSALRPTRARDYLPSAAESPWGGPGAASLLAVSGHATAFSRFVARTLLPWIEV
jgi:hypothetical protein